MKINVIPKNEQANETMLDVFSGKHRAWILRNMGSIRIKVIANNEKEYIEIVIRAVEQTPLHYLTGAQKKQCIDTVNETLKRLELNKDDFGVVLV